MAGHGRSKIQPGFRISLDRIGGRETLHGRASRGGCQRGPSEGASAHTRTPTRGPRSVGSADSRLSSRASATTAQPRSRAAPSRQSAVTGAYDPQPPVAVALELELEPAALDPAGEDAAEERVAVEQGREHLERAGVDPRRDPVRVLVQQALQGGLEQRRRGGGRRGDPRAAATRSSPRRAWASLPVGRRGRHAAGIRMRSRTRAAPCKSRR